MKTNWQYFTTFLDIGAFSAINHFMPWTTSSPLRFYAMHVKDQNNANDD